MKLGPINIKNGIFLAPMEDVSDYPFRMICKKAGADIVYSEFISCEALIRDAEKAFKKMQIHPAEHPIGIQIYGNRIESMVQAAQIAEEKNPDFIDINFGCPVKKVALKGAGAGLLQDIPLMIRICEAVVKHTALPVTAKTRLGWDANSIVICEVAKQMENAGIEAIAIHARTRSQGFKGQADWSWIKKVKEYIKIPVIGNGDITMPQQVKEMFDYTGCDAVMIGRGAVHMPWIFNLAKRFMESGQMPAEPPLQEKIYLLMEHLKLSVAHKGERRAMLEIRKFYSTYLKGMPNIAKFRVELMNENQLSPVLSKLRRLLEEQAGIE
jgi:tRNA-dihydrouridine synthase B